MLFLHLVFVSPHCAWPEDIDEPCELHVSELTTVLGRQVSLRPVVPKRHPTDPWLDAECREFKRATWRLERVFLAACTVVAGRLLTASTTIDLAVPSLPLPKLSDLVQSTL